MKITVSGYYGCGNTGDEAVLAGILDAFEKRGGVGRGEFVVLSQDPSATTLLHGVPAVHRMRFSAVRQAMHRSDLLVSGGGSLLQDSTSLRSLLYYLWVIRFARRCHVPVMLYAQGIGPLHGKAARILTRLAVNGVGGITVRDPASADLLYEIGVRQPTVEVTADPAFALQPDEEGAHAALRASGAGGDAPLVGIAVRPWMAPEPSIAAYARMADLVARETGARLLLLPMQPPGDVELAERIARVARGAAAVIRDPMSPAQALGVVSHLSGLVAMRLHALVFGAVSAIPMVGIGYDPKVPALMETLGQADRCIDLAGFSAEAVAHLLKSAMDEGASLTGTLRARAATCSEAALANVDRALALARGEA